MKVNITTVYLALISVITAFSMSLAVAQTDIKSQVLHEPDEVSLQQQILAMDRLLFEQAFNQCKLDVWEKILPENFEFYDDRSGLNTSRQIEIDSFKDRCSRDKKVTRKLVESEVHPLNHFGAVQLGTHNFYVDDQLVEVARFIHIWKKENEQWVVSRVVSYQHAEVND